MDGQMALFDVEKGERFKAQADEWVMRNPDAWAFIKHQAALRVQDKKRFGIGELCEQVRWHMYAQGNTAFKVNNNHRAALARRLVIEFPACKDYIEMRSSVIDL